MHGQTNIKSGETMYLGNQRIKIEVYHLIPEHGKM